ncbi:small toxic protein shoB [Escherichia coli]|nr:small toxic protein shoB [Escherichia coli]
MTDCRYLIKRVIKIIIAVLQLLLCSYNTRKRS